MHKRTKRLGFLAAFSAAIVTGGGFTIQAAAAVTNHDVRSSDFIGGLSDTRSAGHYDFLKEGLHVYTDDNTGNAKVAEYFAPSSTAIPTSGSYNWYGTDASPGSQIVFDTNSDRSDAGSYNVLVGEQVYTTGSTSIDGDGQNLTDWWYTGGSAKAATNGITCPSMTGGSGSDCHGTLQQWHDADGMSNAEVYAYGFSLGSGVKGDGVLQSQTYGDDKYVFTDEAAASPCPPAPTTQNTTATETTSVSGRNVTVQFGSPALGANKKEGTKVEWWVTIDSSSTRVFYDKMGLGEKATYIYTAPAGKHVVHIYKDGHQVHTETINK
jgi:hypothetical protein